MLLGSGGQRIVALPQVVLGAGQLLGRAEQGVLLAGCRGGLTLSLDLASPAVAVADGTGV
jgi:hypothetical protein